MTRHRSTDEDNREVSNRLPSKTKLSGTFLVILGGVAGAVITWFASYKVVEDRVAQDHAKTMQVMEVLLPEIRTQMAVFEIKLNHIQATTDQTSRDLKTHEENTRKLKSSLGLNGYDGMASEPAHSNQ